MNAGISISVRQEIELELLNLLVSYYFYRKLSGKVLSASGLEALELQVTIAALLQDIVLRLCKFGESNQKTVNFVQALKEMRKKKAPGDRMREIDAKVKEYLTAIEIIQRDHRHKYMAHLSKDKRMTKPRPFTNLPKVIKQAVEICDQLHGDKVSYKIDGWANTEIDLRSEIEP